MEILVILCLVELAVVVGAFWFLYILIDRVADHSYNTLLHTDKTRDVATGYGDKLLASQIHVEQSLQTQIEFLLSDKRQVQLLLESSKESYKMLEAQLLTRDNKLYDQLVNLGKVTVKNEEN